MNISLLTESLLLTQLLLFNIYFKGYLALWKGFPKGVKQIRTSDTYIDRYINKNYAHTCT